MMRMRPAKPRFSASMMWPTHSLTHHSPWAGCHKAISGVSPLSIDTMPCPEASRTLATSEGIQALARGDDEGHRVLDEALDLGHELRRGLAVEHSMVDGQRHAHDLAGHDPAVLDDRHVLDGAYSEDRRLRGVDDRDELVDAIHAQVGDREGRAGEVVLAGPA